MIKTNLLFHLRSIQQCLPRFQAFANLNVADFRLEIKGRNKWYVLQPQFIAKRKNFTEYSPFIIEGTVGFIGWLPYFNRQWPIATDKRSFKGYCAERGLRTPPIWLNAGDVEGDFIIKKNRSAFGKGIRGPFRHSKASALQRKLEDEHEFYEGFIVGDVAKIWYWNEKPVCLERFQMPRLLGDGRRTLRQLIAGKAATSPALVPQWKSFEDLASYQDLALDTIVPEGEKPLGDFRYITPLKPRSLENRNVLHEYLETEVGRQLKEAGAAFWEAIPEQIRAGTLFTVDAIIDEQDRVWFLEANCNPTGHPDIYPHMLQSLLGNGDSNIPLAGVPAAGMPRPFMQEVVREKETTFLTDATPG